MWGNSESPRFLNVSKGLTASPGLPLICDRGRAWGPPRHTCPGRGAHPFTHTLTHEMANVKQLKVTV